METSGLKHRLVKILRVGKITENDFRFFQDRMDIVPPIMTTIVVEPEPIDPRGKEYKGVKPSDYCDIIEKYCKSLTDRQKWQLADDELKRQYEMSNPITEDLTREHKVLFLSILADGIEPHANQLKKILPPCSFAIGFFGKDGKLHTVYGDSPYDNTKGEWINSPLIFWGGTVGDYLDGKPIPKTADQ